MLGAHALEVHGELALHGREQHGHAVLVALGAADRDLAPPEIDGSHAQSAALEEPQARAVEQRSHEQRQALHAREDGAHFFARERHRQARGRTGMDQAVEPGELDPGDVAVEEEQRRERVVLGRGRDAPARRQGVQEGRDVLGAQRCGVAAALELVVAAHPAQVRLRRPRAEVAQAHRGTSALGEARLGARPRGRAARRGPTRLRQA
jgi:hypothetical protein